MNPKEFAPLLLLIGYAFAGCASNPPSPSGSSSAPSSGSDEAGVVNLTGEWMIDEASSDDPAAELESITQASREKRSGSRVSAGVSVFGIPVGDITDLLPERDRSANAGADPPRHVTDATDALDILQSTDSVRVDYDGLGTYLYRNGETMSDNDASVHADWRRGRYVVERQIPNGPLVTEEFRLDSHDASRLYWVVTVKLSSGRNISITRVYDRVTADSPVNNS
jgi:hypothetical protein